MGCRPSVRMSQAIGKETQLLMSSQEYEECSTPISLPSHSDARTACASLFNSFAVLLTLYQMHVVLSPGLVL